ncbi:hypothetical protein GLAREA_12942 [Glarea lozoyensis ATCC 20868]|uniref:Uncharacterized protein n=1 Tax=Glarea lozoyensis (strain ATCC 20868 / MF5171) TaxID=1116229 RepID=S3CZ71_GLAL2|nr:uncharacterized protein GLAREA_12942 [Glarea lozoyensis ATCC 20868]EPE30219.1 hypothetical protein GLAREA_12942 [Glarea lozoyensis ATCC 20868]
MSSSASRGGERMVQQDYIARIRYSNALPPPPNPPKLLEIPNTGLASGQYTTPGYASRLARDQPLNIEADAELGMPLDLVGMPGIFDGDESSIQAPLQLPVPHPHDRALLRPLSTLGKPKFSDTGVSFLRRTEYISSYTSKSRFESTTSRSLIDNTGSKKKRPVVDFDKESPENIKKQVEESFAIAARNLKNKNIARHPTKRNVHVVDAYPLLPDVDAFPDAGGYVTVKFLTNPVPPSTTYDVRVENSMLVPIDPPEEEQAAKQAAQEAHNADPEHNPPPENTLEYELFMPETVDAALNYKRKFDILDNDHQEEDLYTDKQGNGEGCFRFKRVRAYESATSAGTYEEKYDDEVIIALHDGKDGRLQKGAYYYPIVQRISIRPQRQKNIDKRMGRMQSQQEEVTDYMDMRIEDPDAEVIATRTVFRDYPYGESEKLEAEKLEAERLADAASPTED